MDFTRNGNSSIWSDFGIALRLRWPLVLLTSSAGLLVGALLTWERPLVYEATATLLVEEERSTTQVLRAATEPRSSSGNRMRRIETELLSGPLLLEVIEGTGLVEEWKLSHPEEALAILRKGIHLDRGAEPGTLRLSVSDGSAEIAAILCNEMAREMMAREEIRAMREVEDRVRNLQGELEARHRTIAEMEARLLGADRPTGESSATNSSEIQDLRRDLVTESHLVHSLEARKQLALVELQEVTGGMELRDEAIAADAEVWDERPKILALSSTLGLALGCLLLGIAGRGGMAEKLVAKISERLDLSIAGVVPVGPKLLVRCEHPAEALIEPYRELRFKLHRLPARESLCLAFQAVEDKAPCSEVVANLAVVMAAGGHSVVVIDGNLRQATLHEHFDAARHPGLSDFLCGEMRLEETVVKTRTPNLWFMPAGPVPNDPGGLLSGKRMDDLSWELKSRFDYILINSPPIRRYAEAGVVSALADYVFVVTSDQRYSMPELLKIQRTLQTLGSSLSGVLVSRMIEQRDRKSGDLLAERV